MLWHACLLGGPQTNGDKIRSGYLTRAFSGIPKRGRKCDVTPAFSGIPKPGAGGGQTLGLGRQLPPPQLTVGRRPLGGGGGFWGGG